MAESFCHHAFEQEKVTLEKFSFFLRKTNVRPILNIQLRVCESSSIVNRRNEFQQVRLHAFHRDHRAGSRRSVRATCGHAASSHMRAH